MNIIWHNDSFLLQDHTDGDVTIAKSVGFEYRSGWRTTDSNVVQELHRRVIHPDAWVSQFKTTRLGMSDLALSHYNPTGAPVITDSSTDDVGATPSPQTINQLPKLIGNLFRTVQALNEIFPGRPFTPDGHLVGSIGEVVAAETYGLILEKCSHEGFDAKTESGQTVEIKLTGGSSVSISSDAATPKILIVLKLDSRAGFEEIYNGEFPLDLWKRKKPSKRRVSCLSISALRKRNPKLLPQKNPIAELNKLFSSAEVLDPAQSS
jgi:hypothetical protein